VRKAKKKRKSGEAYNINKQTIHTVPKSKIESRAHYIPEPARGGTLVNLTGCICKTVMQPNDQSIFTDWMSFLLPNQQ